jgi:hypothetical protein
METNTNKPQQKKKNWFLALGFSLLLSTFLVFLTVFTSSNPSPLLYHETHVKNQLPHFVESKMGVSAANSKDSVPRLAYLISGSMGDGQSLKRTLKALYHPRNQYVVHLDLEASPEERLELAEYVRNEPLFKALGNVRMLVRANLVTYRGPTMVSNTLHAAAVLLRDGGEWDWFINLSASDYPLVTQDGKEIKFWAFLYSFQ